MTLFIHPPVIPLLLLDRKHRKQQRRETVAPLVLHEGHTASDFNTVASIMKCTSFKGQNGHLCLVALNVK